MLQNTQDIFYLVLSISLGVIALLLAVLLVYWIAILHKILGAAQRIEESILAFREKLQISAYLKIFSTVAQHLIGFFQNKKERAKKAKNANGKK